MKTLTKLLAVALVLVLCVGMFGSGAYALVGNNGAIDPGPTGSSGLVVSGGTGLVASDNSNQGGSDAGLAGTGNTGLVNDSGLVGTEEDGVMYGEGEVGQFFGLAHVVSLNGATAAFTSLTTALADDSAQTSGAAKSVTVKLTGNLTEAGVTIADQTEMRTINLDLNGKTLDLGAGAINIGTNNKLVISGSGTVKGTATMITGSGTANIWGGTYSGFSDIDSGATVTLYGGTYRDLDISDSTVLGDATIADGCSVAEESKSGVTNYTIVGAVASIGDTLYATVGAAIAAANPGDTITLEKDTAAEELTVAKQLTIDLNGHALKLSKTMVVEDDLTIDDATGGSVVGPSSSSTLFKIKDETNSGALTINGGYMKSYSTLYTRESTGTTTPVNLMRGSSYQVKPTNLADVESGCVVAGSSPTFYIVDSTKPTVKIGSVVYDYELFKKGLSNGFFQYDPQSPSTYPGNYTLTVSSPNLNSVKVYANEDLTTSLFTVPAGNFDESARTVKLKASDGTYNELIAGLYMVRFSFDEGDVDAPLYILPTVTVNPKEKVMPDASTGDVTFTFANAGEADKFTYSFGLKSAGKSAAKDLLADTDYTISGNVLTLNYDYLNENCTPGDYYLYCNYDEAIAFPVALKITGKTDASTNTPATSTPAVTSSPTSTTASIKYNNANPSGVWYKGYSSSLKFNVNPGNVTVEVGGQTLTSDQYSISNGVLTLNNTYLNTLPYMHSGCIDNGTCANGASYTIRVYSDDGTSAATTFQLKPYFAAVNGVVNHTYGGSNTLSFVSSDPIEEVYVGGTLLSSSYYTLSNENRTLTLSAAFLNNQLSLGKYSLTVHVRSTTDGQLHKADSIQFSNVTASYAASTTYKMGDNNNIYIWIAVLVICAVAVVALIPKKKKASADASAPADTAAPEDKQE